LRNEVPIPACTSIILYREQQIVDGQPCCRREYILGIPCPLALLQLSNAKERAVNARDRPRQAVDTHLLRNLCGRQSDEPIIIRRQQEPFRSCGICETEAELQDSSLRFGVELLQGSIICEHSVDRIRVQLPDERALIIPTRNDEKPDRVPVFSN